MIEAGTPPEKILSLLGISEPEDLDIDAIAFACGATILRQPLTGCEANIIGSGDKAIITVNIKSIPGRQRFSSGHELGHWMKDRGQNAFGCSKRQMNSEWTDNNAETRANRFASDLLLPLSMFVPLAKARPITLETVYRVDPSNSSCCLSRRSVAMAQTSQRTSLASYSRGGRLGCHECRTQALFSSSTARRGLGLVTGIVS